MNCNIIILIFVLQLCIACDQRPNEDLGDRYRFGYDEIYSDAYTIYIGEYVPIILPNVINYKYDNNFITASQKPYEEIAKNINNYDSILKAFRESNLFYYWIIDKSARRAIKKAYGISRSVEYGPYSYEEFLHKCQELEVPEYLILKKEKNNRQKPQ